MTFEWTFARRRILTKFFCLIFFLSANAYPSGKFIKFYERKIDIYNAIPVAFFVVVFENYEPHNINKNKQTPIKSIISSNRFPVQFYLKLTWFIEIIQINIIILNRQLRYHEKNLSSIKIETNRILNSSVGFSRKLRKKHVCFTSM